MSFSIIAAASLNRVIGSKGDLPWHLRSDLRRFSLLTKGHTVIMGRVTHESILNRLRNPLPERNTVVVTRQKDYAAPGCVVLPSWEAVKEQFQSEEEVFVLGGEQIYKAAISDCSRIYLTTVKTECEGDAFFPLHEDFGRWKVVETQECLKSEHDDYPSSFQILEKEGRPNLVIGNTRNPEQAEYYRRLRDDGVVCAFCKPDIYKYGIRPIQKDGKHWLVMENMAPYENTKVHLLVISKDHAETLADLDPQAGVELLTFLQELEVEHKVLSGGIAWRFGDPAHNGGSVNHLHIHFIVPDKEAVEYKPVRFKIG